MYLLPTNYDGWVKMLIICFVSILLISTSLADALTTIQVMEIEDDVEETNPLVRMMMNHLGEKRTMWITFGISLVLFLALAFYTMQNELSFSVFILFGLVVSIMQGAVAHTNWTGKVNIISRVTYAFFSWHENLFSLLFSEDSTGNEE